MIWNKRTMAWCWEAAAALEPPGHSWQGRGLQATPSGAWCQGLNQGWAYAKHHSLNPVLSPWPRFIFIFPALSEYSALSQTFCSFDPFGSLFLKFFLTFPSYNLKYFLPFFLPACLPPLQPSLSGFLKHPLCHFTYKYTCCLCVSTYLLPQSIDFPTQLFCTYFHLGQQQSPKLQIKQTLFCSSDVAWLHLTLNLFPLPH